MAAKRTIRTALWRYETPDGSFRIGYHGDEVELSKAEVARGEAEGVFNPVAPAAVQPPEVAAQLSGIEPRVSTPTGADESDAAPLNHDIQPDLAALLGDDEPAESAPAVEPAPAPEPAEVPVPVPVEQPATELKRPAKAASHDKWVEYVHKRTGRPEAELAKLTKDELQAIQV